VTQTFTPETLTPEWVLGAPVHLLPDYSGWLLQRLADGQGSHVITLNAEMVMQSRCTPELRAVLEQADLVVPDGAGIVLHFLLHGKQVQRRPGIELAESLLQAAARPEHSLNVFCYGGKPGVAEAAMQQWQQRLPKLKIAGIQDGYHTPEFESELLRRLEQLQPQLIFVGLGVPRQEYWIARHRQVCPQAIWVGVGGSFDIWSGLKTRAPGWLRNNNLEWVYRLYQEPWRWRRMLALPKFAWQSLLSRVTGS
jgi:N-acetylglucosaminyldiphosphoundecaprenol N-acetyl-beta-D-mannosaminyltransferase